jgi:hypothetical protein
MNNTDAVEEGKDESKKVNKKSAFDDIFPLNITNNRFEYSRNKVTDTSSGKTCYYNCIKKRYGCKAKLTLLFNDLEAVNLLQTRKIRVGKKEHTCTSLENNEKQIEMFDGSDEMRLLVEEMDEVTKTATNIAKEIFQFMNEKYKGKKYKYLIRSKNSRKITN